MIQQWEYKIEIVDFGAISLKAYLNNAGTDGWELCFYHCEAQRIGECIFKRPIQPPSTAEKIFNKVKNEVEDKDNKGWYKPGSVDT